MAVSVRNGSAYLPESDRTTGRESSSTVQAENAYAVPKSVRARSGKDQEGGREAGEETEEGMVMKFFVRQWQLIVFVTYWLIIVGSVAVAMFVSLT